MRRGDTMVAPGPSEHQSTSGVPMPRGWRLEESLEAESMPPAGFSWTWHAPGSESRGTERAVVTTTEEESWPMPYDQPIGSGALQPVPAAVDTDTLHGGRRAPAEDTPIAREAEAAVAAMTRSQQPLPRPASTRTMV